MTYETPRQKSVTEKIYDMRVEARKKKEYETENKEPTYYYKWGKHHNSKYGGQDGILEVYEVKDGEIKKVGETFIQTRAMKGYEGETMDVLLKNGKITQEEYNLSESKNSGKGYYSSSHKFKIKELK